MAQVTHLKVDNFNRIQGASLTIENKVYPLFKGINTVGRNRSATINIKHLNVSQNQATIVLVDDKQHFIADLNSSNGTFILNNKMVPFKLYELTNNAQIKFGDVIAVYSKISTSNKIINLQQTLDTTEMTQNMTQNFYASNTQLIFNKESSDNRHSNQEQSDMNPFRIHEEATQVVNNPTFLNITQNVDNKNEPQESIIEGQVDNSIHDVPTQICDYASTLKSQSNNININDAPTQVSNIPKKSQNSQNSSEHSNTTSSNSNTQILTTEEREDIANRVNAKFNLSKNVVVISESLESDNVINKNNDLINDDKQNKEEQCHGTDDIKSNKHNKIHYSQEPSTSGLGVGCMEYDDSFLNLSINNRTNDVLVEESLIENTNSNDSVDFLVIENTQKETSEKVNLKSSVENDSQTSVESDFIARPKKKPQQLLDSQVDSDTDTETTQDMLKTVQKPVPKLPDTPTEYQSDTIDTTQEIGFRKKVLKPILECSDSETDTPKRSRKKKQTADNSDSETDCEDINKPPIKVTATKGSNDISDSDTDCEDLDKPDLDDTDCIPSTQDAFAEALGYKPMKVSQMNSGHSSEESFKLGLTELMNFTENDNEENIDKQKDKSDEENLKTTERANSVDVKKTVDDEKLLDNGDVKKISNHDEEVSKKFTFKKKSTNFDGSLSTIFSSNEGKNSHTTTNDTADSDKEKISTLNNEIDNVFLQPTQVFTVINSEENKDCKNSGATTTSDVADDVKGNISTSTKGNDDNDIFLQPTQILPVNDSSEQINDGKNVTEGMTDSDKEKLSTSTTSIDDDVFLQPTQVLITNDSEHVFVKPADKTEVSKKKSKVFNSQSKSKNVNTQDDEDMYLATTQMLQGNSQKPNEVNLLTQEDIYIQSTQMLVGEQKDSAPSKNNDDDVYMQPTQQISTDNNADATETQLEFQNFDNIEIEFSTGTDRPLNPLLRELDKDSNEKTELTSKSSHSTKEVVDDEKPVGECSTTSNDEDIASKKTTDSNKKNVTETLSQIEEFIKKPLPPRQSLRKPHSNKGVSNTTEVIPETTQDETLSQIEAFIKKPLIPPKLIAKEPLPNKSVVEEDRPETLSQIVAFVNKPLPKNEDANKTISTVRKSSKRSPNTSEDQTGERRSFRKLEPIDEDKVAQPLSDEASKDSEEESDRRDTSQDLRTDVDQSFALLESKNSKTRRKHDRGSVLDEIKVTVTSHRRSMSMAENMEKNLELVIPIKKLRKTGKSLDTGNAKVPRRKTLSKGSAIVEDNTVNTIKESDTVAGSSGAKVLTNTSKTRKSKVTSTGTVTEDSETKIDKTNVIDLTKNDNENLESGVSSNPNTETPRKRPTRARTPSITSTANENNVKTSANRKKSTLQKNEETKGPAISDSSLEETNKTKGANTSRPNKKKSEPDDEDDENQVRSGRAAKRHMIDSSDDASGSSTPVKQRRAGKRSHTFSSSTTGSSSRESSTSNETTTPRKGRNVPKVEELVSPGERSKRKLKPKVVFTMLDNPQLESYIKHLGGSIVDTVASATVLMTESVKRSQKLLTAVALGKPICPPKWVKDSKKNSEFLDPWDYILIDKESEAKWNFSLKESLKRAANKKLLTGYSFQLLVSNNGLDVLKAAIEASGGKCVLKLPAKNQMENLFVVASPENKTKYTKIKKQNPDITIIEPEAIFDAVLRQELRFSRHILT